MQLPRSSLSGQAAAAQRQQASTATVRPTPVVTQRRSGSRVRVCTQAPEKPAVDLEKSALRWVKAEEGRQRQLSSKTQPEKIKTEKCGSAMWTEVHELASLIREGKTSWEDLNLDDINVRFKWAGLFHRAKRTPKKFMMRIKVPSGELNGDQLRYMGGWVRKYGDQGCGDITTRAAIQLRGVTIEDADLIQQGLLEHGLTAYQTGMDNVRNLTGSPIAGIDPHEVVDVRELLRDIQAMITNNNRGNPELCNLPRKINICVSPSRDDFPHTQINDVGFEAVRDPELNNEVVYNLVVGGYFSAKRNMMSIPTNISVRHDQMVPFCRALLEVFRDFGPRQDRQKARMIWLVEELGEEKWKSLIEQYMGGVKLRPHVKVHHDTPWERRDVLGVHDQKQEGYCWVGACVPSGRLLASDFDEFARIAEAYGDGTVRLTCEENVLFPNIPKDKVDAMLQEPLFQRFKVSPGKLSRAMVSCTGSQFCGFGLAETKMRAIDLMDKLEQQLELPRTVRIHFTGCPNSCGQAQVGDIGLMGAPAKKDGKAVEGFKMYLGGKIGENPELAKEFEKGIPVEKLEERLREVLISEFGATPKQAVAA